MSKKYSMPSDQAYETVLDVLPAGQRWFSFDVPMRDARNGEAKRFGMTLWNFHCIDGTRDFESWGITRDSASGTHWYRVAKARSGETSKNRKSLWDALHIASRMPRPFPMKGILKDGKSRACSPAHAFNISDVQLQADGSALWLKLDIRGGDAGTDVNESLLPKRTAVPPADSTRTSHGRILPDEAYLALLDAAANVHFQGADRQDALESLYQEHGINKGTASAILNNFRCLLVGQGFKAPMRAFGLQLFVDAIIAKLGNTIVPNVVAATEAYIRYAESTLKQDAPGFRSVLDALKHEADHMAYLQRLVSPVEGTHAADRPSSPGGRVVPSEILREVWVRGPQHAAFRRALERRWKKKCAVRGTPCNGLLRASHIVAWSLDEQIRGDVSNGLLLSVPLDNLFDRGLISFDDAGTIICSAALGSDTAEHFGVRPSLQLAWEHLSDRERQALRVNLARHRALHQL